MLTDTEWVDLGYNTYKYRVIMRNMSSQLVCKLKDPIAKKYYTDTIWIHILERLFENMCDNYPSHIETINDIPIVNVVYKIELFNVFPRNMEIDFKKYIAEILDFINKLEDLFNNDRKLLIYLGRLKNKINTHFLTL
jgi:hypothetical protein